MNKKIYLVTFGIEEPIFDKCDGTIRYKETGGELYKQIETYEPDATTKAIKIAKEKCNIHNKNAMITQIKIKNITLYL